MVRYLVENQIVHPCPVQFALPGIRIGDNPPTFRARPPEDDASDMKNKIDTLKPGTAQRVMEELVQFVSPQETRHALERGWGIKVRDMATTSEMTPWATNGECEAGQGVHVIQDEVWTEIVAKDDAHRHRPEGESGAIVYTHLKRESQPMIRFYSGDESHMTNEPCACGRTYPRLPAGVYGRLDDMLLIRGANVDPSQVQRSLLEVPGTGVEFKIVLEKKGALDHATVLVERDPSLAPHDVEKFSADLKDRVRRKLKNDTAVNFEVDILPPNTLERALSKAKRVGDRRPKYRPTAT